MRILIVSQYFWPESFRINDLALGLQERGLEVLILTGQPNYPNGNFYKGYSFLSPKIERWNGIKIFRVPLVPRGKGGGIRLAMNYLSFAFFASVESLFLKEKIDKIFVFEPSPITVGIPAVLIKKLTKAPIYFWVQDLWPESVSAAGQISNSLVLNLLNSLTKWVYKYSDKILIQSKGFRNYIEKQGVRKNKIFYFPNSTEALYKTVQKRQKYLNLMPNSGFTVMFAGNIGEAQDFNNVIKAAKLINGKVDNINFVVLGDGRKKEFVELEINRLGLAEKFHLIGAFPTAEMPYFFACADALLVTLKKDEIFSMTIPSKLQSYLACSKPIIAALDGEGAKVVSEADCGFVSEPGNSEELAANIMRLAKLSIEKRMSMGRNARMYFEDNFERELLLDRLIKILNQVDSGQ